MRGEALALAAVAGAVAAGGLAAVLAGGVSACGPVDPPRARGSHHRPTPTSGGLAIAAGACVGVSLGAALLPLAARLDLAGVAAALGMALGLGALGAVDDVLDMGAKPKLLIQAVVSLAFALLVARVEALPLTRTLSLPLGPWIGAVGTALWLVVATNAVNFMDGANGVAAGALAVALAALGAAALAAGEPLVALAAWTGAAANAGYLPWNLKGRLFQGDVGALFTGFLFSALAIVAVRGGVSVYVGPLALLPFLTDVLLTLLHRARRGQSLLQAHRDHLYQLWLQRTGGTHPALAGRVAAVMAAYGALAVGLQLAPAEARLPILGVGLIVCVMGWRSWRERLERAAAAEPLTLPSPRRGEGFWP